MWRKRIGITLLVVMICLLLAAVIYQFPPIHNRLSWRIDTVRSQILYALHPPEEVVFIPQAQGKLDQGPATPSPESPKSPVRTPTHTPKPSVTQPGSSLTPTETSKPTHTNTPIPEKVILTGVIHEYQQMNNCGPATLSMALTFWGWQGDQRDTRAYLRPNWAMVDDKNVSPFEMAKYVNTQTQLKAIARVGGDIGMLKNLIAKGFPVIIEKGFQPPKEDWMGHYELVTGYDDGRSRFTTQDSYIMPDFPVPYEDVSDRWWRDFNHVFLIIYPNEREDEVFAVLGPFADIIENYRRAAQRAGEATSSLTGRDLFFAWYNLGSNQLGMGDPNSASQSYDQAFGIYSELPEDERPWRMQWYQTGPYEAYYKTGRFQDVITLANQTLSFLGAPILEESLYWRGLAKDELGDHEGAISDLIKAAEINPSSTEVLLKLQNMGASFP